jgi:hypothetical protein
LGVTLLNGCLLMGNIIIAAATITGVYIERRFRYQGLNCPYFAFHKMAKYYCCRGNNNRSIYRVTMLISTSFIRRLGEVFPRKGINIRKWGLEDFGGNTLKWMSFNGKYYHCRGNNNRSIYRAMILISMFKLSIFCFS